MILWLPQRVCVWQKVNSIPWGFASINIVKSQLDAETVLTRESLETGKTVCPIWQKMSVIIIQFEDLGNHSSCKYTLTTRAASIGTN